MPKYRKLYVKTTESLDINDMPNDTYRLLWVLLPLGLCREGRGIDNQAWIKAKIMPLRQDITEEAIGEMMDWFTDRKMIVRYEVKSRRYFYIPTFHDYQGNTTREAESNYPSPDNSLKSNSRVSQEEVLGEQRETRIASASAYCILNNESESEFPTDAYDQQQNNDTPKAIDIYQQITEQISIPSGKIDSVLYDLEIVVDCYKKNSEEPDIEHGKRVFSKWCSTLGKNGRHYKRTNPGWIQWWIDELAPSPEQKLSRDTIPSYLFEEETK